MLQMQHMSQIMEPSPKENLNPTSSIEDRPNPNTQLGKPKH